jgi:hypothetical protein
VSFPVKLFTIKGNLVFMNNLYHKFAVASVCTALSFVLGPNEEVKAATITLTPTIQFGVNTRFNRFNVPSSELSPQYDIVLSPAVRGGGPSTRLAEFNISSFFLAPNTIIRSAVFQDKIFRVGGLRPVILGISGYVGNGTAEASDFDNGVFLSSVDISSSSPGDTLSFDVTTFVNQRASNGNTFAGFAINISTWGLASLGGTDALGRSSLVIETVDAAEPVPEPTTIFGSAIGLCLGGWLKRKKSRQQNKTAQQR